MVKQRSVPAAALRIVLIYLAFGVSWIVITSEFVHVQVEPAYKGAFEIAKGLFYVVVTGGLLYVLIQRELANRAALKHKLGEKDAYLSLALKAGKSAAYHWNPETGEVTWSHADGVSASKDLIKTLPVGGNGINQIAHAEILRAIGERVPFSVMIRLTADDGVTHWYENRGQRLPAEGDDPGLVVGIVSEVTTQIETQMKLEELSASLDAEVRSRTESLSAANRELQTFNQAVAHDLRAPLRAIHGYATVLMEEASESLRSEGGETLEKIVESSTRLAEMFDGLQRIGQVTNQEVADELIDMSELATGIARRLQTADVANVKIQPDLTARGDRRLVELILQNLMENAFKFSSRTPNATVEFGQALNGSETMFFVRDNGPGFGPNEGEKLFDLFRRGRGSQHAPGQGIGLATVASAVRRMGGRVMAESAPGEGATFWFTFSE